MTNETEIPLSEARPGDMVLLGPFRIEEVHTRDALPMVRVWGVLCGAEEIHRITRSISEADALRAENERLKARVEELETIEAARATIDHATVLAHGAKAPTIPEGFTPHTGGPRPVRAGSLTTVVFRNGDQSTKDTPEIWGWSHTGDGSDIIAYRLIAPPHGLPGFGPIKEGPPPEDAERMTFAVYTHEGWYEPKSFARFWDEATAHAMRGE